MSDTHGESDEVAGRLRSGDCEALAEAFAAQRTRLWRLVNFRMDRRLQGRVDPDDILQDAYLAAVQRIDHYRTTPEMSPFVWLRLIVCQTLVDAHRPREKPFNRSPDASESPPGERPSSRA